ncbi:ubiquitin-like domain-containing CTD phosphatase 1 [Solea senegalensis]|uniref:Ubiquitin-like domain-containing CTD phosphatase 1 n=1 Tax=Solea senegalensis TaxID=28829 RepID=A0AAV6SFH5_SOLSE|nr:ubiquitin-like domain-containing CTD phosphatase 1 [Solea senegalensis]
MSVSVIIKWGGQEYSISSLSEEDTVMDLKQSIKTLTGVLPERQKLLGLKVKGKPAEDEVKLGSLKLKPNTKIMMMGTREESLEEVLAPPPENDDVVNDFDIEEEVIEVENREENLAKIARRVKDYKVEELNPPREGKSLLVLDVDYTLFDHKSCAETGLELMRPYLHEFLTSAYEDYDIVIWSATSMKWIDAKMKELGVTDNPNYKITFMLDSAAMITVHTPKRGVVEVKPLGVIWGKYGEFYNRKNTIMFDDIGRNFLMNPQNGLKVGGRHRRYHFDLHLFLLIIVARVCVRFLFFCFMWRPYSLDSTLHEGSPEQRERQGAVQTFAVPQRNCQA